MEVEVIPSEVKVQKSQTSVDDSYKDLEEDTPPEFREPEQKPNEFVAWLKQNKLIAGSIGVAVVIMLGVIGFQIFASEPEKKVVEVRTFEECLEQRGTILEGSDPRECYLRQVRFVEEVQPKEEPEEEETPTQSEKEPEEEEITETTYTNDTFPNFSIDYPSDWKKTEDNTETGSTLLLQKDGLTLTYNIGLIEIFGDQGGRCTNNTFLFLDIEETPWYRVRMNDGERYYTTNLQLKGEGDPDNNPEEIDLGDTSKARTEWVEVMPMPEGVYEACLIGSTNIAGVTETNIPAEAQTNTGNKSGLVTIRISGIDESNQAALKEADQIAASTII